MTGGLLCAAKEELMSAENNRQPNNPEKSSSTINKNNDDIVFYSNKKKPSAPSRAASTTPKASKASDLPKGTPKTKKQARKSVKPGKLPPYRIFINAVACTLAVCLILGGSVLIWGFNLLDRFKFKNEDTSTDTQQTSASSPFQEFSTDTKDTSTDQDNEIDTYSGELLEDPMVLNIMLFGEDTRKGSDTGNSDTMIIFSIDTRHKKLKMLSLMRDTYVEIPGYGENRINAAYSLGGAALTVKTVQKNYGIKIDRYAVVDFQSFKKIIDTLGGIDLALTTEEVDYINWQSWINQQTEYKQAEGDYKESVREQLRYVWMNSVPESEKPINKNNYTFTTPEGKEDEEPTAVVHLNGKQALWHARNRGENGICSGDDFTRTKRQRTVISTMINNLKDADPGQLLSVIYEIGPLVTTNLKATQMVSLAKDAVSTYIKYQIVTDSAPNLGQFGSNFYFSDENHPIYINGAFSSVILVKDWYEFRRQIAEFIFEEQVEAA